MGRKRIVSPLFPQLPADRIKSLKIYRQTYRHGDKARRLMIPKSEYTLSSGEVFEYNPFDTTESDIERFFGRGEFFLEPIGHDFKILPGRGLCIGALPKQTAAQRLTVERDHLAERLTFVTTEKTGLLETVASRDADIERLTKDLERTKSYLDSKSKALELCYKRESEDQKRHRDELKKLRDHLQKTIISMVETREAIVRHAMDPADGVLTLAQIRDGIDKSITKELLADAFQSAWSTDTMSLVLGVGGVILGMAYLLYGAKSLVAPAAASATPAAPAPEGGP